MLSHMRVSHDSCIVATIVMSGHKFWDKSRTIHVATAAEPAAASIA